MNAVVKQNTWQLAIDEAKDKFTQIAQAEGNMLNYQKEAMFAMQSVQNNSYLTDAAKNNPQSLRDAVINVASIGLSLNPAEKLAYLVPRDKRACLDISYIGLIKLATDTGSILWAKAALVYEADVFEMTGVNSVPIHKFSPFAKNRGQIVGGYSIAKLHNGDYMVDVQAEEYFNRCRNVAKTKAIWDAWPEAMRLKTLIKVGSKFWPKSKKLDAAIHYLNENEGADFNVVEQDDEIPIPKAISQGEAIPEATEEVIPVVEGEVVPKATEGGATVSAGQIRVIKAKMKAANKTDDDIKAQFGYESVEQIPSSMANEVLGFLKIV